MSRSTKYILGGLTVIGASLYIYEQQVKQVADKRKVQHDGILSSFQNNKSNDRDLRAVGAEKGYKVGESLESLKSKANKQLNELDVPEKFNGAISDIERKRSELANAVSSKAQELSDYASDHADKHGKQSKYLYDEAHKNDPGFFTKLVNKSGDKIDEVSNRVVNDVDQTIDSSKSYATQLADKYIDNVNKVGISTENAVFGTKKSIEDAAYDAKNDIKAKGRELEAEGKSWFNWGAAKKDEAKDEVSRKYNEATNKAASDAGWFSSWGRSSSEKAKDDAIKQYKKAKQELAQAKDEAVSGGKSWLKWGEKQSQQASNDAQRKLQQAEASANEALANLKQYGQETIDSINRSLPQDRHGISEEELAQRSFTALRGWGDSAAEFAEDELRTIDSYNLKHPRGDNWADDLWNRSENLSRYAYENARQKYHKLTNEAEKSKNKTQGWFSSQSKDLDKKSDHLQNDLNRQLDEAKVQLDKAQDNFNSWLSKSGKTLADYTDDAIDGVKKGLKVGHDEAQKGLTEGKDWVNSKK